MEVAEMEKKLVMNILEINFVGQTHQENLKKTVGTKLSHN